jgi:uncharacterized protein (DUF1810 family)
LTKGGPRDPGMADLDRFTRAQAQAVDGFETALRELRAGQKRSHWIWYVFPQLAGLGSSTMAARYGLRGVDEATRYLRDPLLRARLLDLLRIIDTQIQGRPASGISGGPARSLVTLMGSEIDARKLVSSLTLFREIARRLRTQEGHTGADTEDALAEYLEVASGADAVLEAAAAQGLPECAWTRRELGG